MEPAAIARREIESLRDRAEVVRKDRARLVQGGQALPSEVAHYRALRDEYDRILALAEHDEYTLHEYAARAIGARCGQ